MRREYRHSLKNHIKELGFSITTTVIGLATLFFIQFQTGQFLIDFLILLFIVTILPVFYLYFEYLSFNKRGAVFTIDFVKREIIYTDNTCTQIVGFDEIDKICVHTTPSWTRRDKVKMMPFEQFHYARIFTKTEEIIVSSHLADSVNVAVMCITNVKIEQRTRIFPSILLE